MIRSSRSGCPRSPPGSPGRARWPAAWADSIDYPEVRDAESIGTAVHGYIRVAPFDAPRVEPANPPTRQHTHSGGFDQRPAGERENRADPSGWTRQVLTRRRYPRMISPTATRPTDTPTENVMRGVMSRLAYAAPVL